MSIEIIQTNYFSKEFKRFAKHYKGLLEDYADFINHLKENPLLGVEIAPNVHKLRMKVSAKCKGKSGGLRVITLNVLVSEQDGIIYLLLIYDKSETSNIKKNVVESLVKEILG